jgi:hypothetical protein
MEGGKVQRMSYHGPPISFSFQTVFTNAKSNAILNVKSLSLRVERAVGKGEGGRGEAGTGTGVGIENSESGVLFFLTYFVSDWFWIGH